MATRTRSRWGVGQTNRRWRFTPYQPPPIPLGFYDPALDAQRRAAERGLGDLQQDVNTANTRDTVDYGLGRQDILRSADRSLADLGRTRTQTLEDLGTSRSRIQEDYDRNVALLTQAYQRLEDRQKQQAAGAGVLDGGALLQAAAKRSSNMAQDRAELDTARNRALADIDTRERRLQEGVDLDTGRIGEDRDLALGRLALDLAPPDAANPLGGRRFQDRTVQVTRAGRENTQFGIDVEAQKAAQAAAAGYTPAQVPGGQFFDPSGQPRRVVRVGGFEYVVDPSGRVLQRRRVKV